METEKRNIFVDFAQALYNFKAYTRFMNNNGIKVFAHGFLLSLLSIIPIIVSFITFNLQIGPVDDLIDEYVPDFVIQNGRLSIPQPYYLVDNENQEYLICIDTMQDFTKEDLYTYFDTYETVILADSEELFIASDKNNQNKTQTITFSELNEFSSTINNDSLKELASFITPIFIVLLIIIYIFILIGVFFFTLIKTVLTAIVASMLKINLKYSETYKLTIYATTITYVVAFVFGILPFKMPFLSTFLGTIKLVLFCVYIVMALKTFRDNLLLMPNPSFNPQGNMNYPPNGYNPQQGNMNYQPNGFNSQQGNMNYQPNGFNPQQDNMNYQPNSFNPQQGYTNQPNGFNPQQDNMNYQPNGFNPQQGYTNQPNSFEQNVPQYNGYDEQAQQQAPKKTYAEINEELANQQYNDYNNDNQQ